ncbi:MAG TPA: RhuM family protein [Lutibacter sp.]|nr:RhuM family protein [Lutibacter sp.]
MNNGEIIIYQPNTLSHHIEVRMEDETVWLTQIQMTELFNVSKQNISLHINNIFKEGELRKEAVVKYSLTTASDGKKYKTKLYNLDVIISVGYRVKSKTGTHFRIWANQVLKDYLLKGYALNNRVEMLERKVSILEIKNNDFDFLIKTNLPPNEGIFYDGQIFDAYQFVSEIIKSAKKSVTLIDNYLDESVLMLLAKRNSKVQATIYTNKFDQQLKCDLEKHNMQYNPVVIKIFKKSHDRFLIIDQHTVYHIGASLKDLGKKWFAFSKMTINASEIIEKLNN